MRREPVDSTSLRSVGYDDTSRVLEVEFVNGSVYLYFGVPREAYDELLTADSLGRHFNHHIRDTYAYRRL